MTNRTNGTNRTDRTNGSYRLLTQADLDGQVRFPIRGVSKSNGLFAVRVAVRLATENQDQTPRLPG